MPGIKGSKKHSFRGSRVVVLPEFQGRGFGVRLSEFIAELYIRNGFRYFARTAHPKMGEFRNNSEKWKETSSSRKKAGEIGRTSSTPWQKPDTTRVCWSHEYIGDTSDKSSSFVINENIKLVKHNKPSSKTSTSTLFD